MVTTPLSERLEVRREVTRGGWVLSRAEVPNSESMTIGVGASVAREAGLN